MSSQISRIRLNLAYIHQKDFKDMINKRVQKNPKGNLCLQIDAELTKNEYLRRKVMANSGRVQLHGGTPKFHEQASLINTHQRSLTSHFASYYLCGLSTIGTPILNTLKRFYEVLQEEIYMRIPEECHKYLNKTTCMKIL